MFLTNYMFSPIGLIVILTGIFFFHLMYLLKVDLQVRRGKDFIEEYYEIRDLMKKTHLKAPIGGFCFVFCPECFHPLIFDDDEYPHRKIFRCGSCGYRYAEGVVGNLGLGDIIGDMM